MWLSQFCKVVADGLVHICNYRDDVARSVYFRIGQRNDKQPMDTTLLKE